MSADRYGSTDAVRIRSGVSAPDLGLDSEDELDTFLTELLDEVTDLCDRVMRQSYLTEDVPKGLDGIANDAATDALRDMVAGRQTPIVRIDDLAVRVIQTRVLSPDIKDRLSYYGKGRGLVSVDMDQEFISDAPIGIVLVQPDLDDDTGQ